MHPLVSLAKKAVETYIKEGKIITPPEDLPKEFLQKKAGVFVTIEKKGELRGCIGTYLPVRENIANEVIFNAIASATEDWRFGKIQKEELPELSFIVYILSNPQPVKDLKELDPKKYGVIVKTSPFLSLENDVIFNGHQVPKTGVLLPDIEGVETVEQQISIACQKAGIDPTKEKIFIYKFTVEKYQ